MLMKRMFAEERREKILELVNEEKRVLAKVLAEEIQISIDSMTPKTCLSWRNKVF